MPIPVKNVHRIIGEGNANENALVYEKPVANFFVGLHGRVFDLILLGMVRVAHPSLFPIQRRCKRCRVWVVPNQERAVGSVSIHANGAVFIMGGDSCFLLPGKKRRNASGGLPPRTRIGAVAGSGNQPNRRNARMAGGCRSGFASF